MTTSSWIRHFVKSHEQYKSDSLVPDIIDNDSLLPIWRVRLMPLSTVGRRMSFCYRIDDVNNSIFIYLLKLLKSKLRNLVYIELYRILSLLFEPWTKSCAHTLRVNQAQDYKDYDFWGSRGRMSQFRDFQLSWLVLG